MLNEPSTEDPALLPKAREGNSCPKSTDTSGDTEILSGALLIKVKADPGIDDKNVNGANDIEGSPKEGNVLLDIAANGVIAELGTDTGIELSAAPIELVASGNNGKVKELDSAGTDGTLLGAKLDGKVDRANELGTAPELATDDNGKLLNEVPEDELNVPKLDEVAAGAKPEDDAKGRPNDSGVAKPLDCKARPDNIGGMPEEALGKELGNELNPGSEDADHNGPQIGKVASDNDADSNEPTGCELDNTRGADNEAVNGYNTDKALAELKYEGSELIDLDGSPDGVNEVLGNKLEPIGLELEATSESFKLASGSAELDKGNKLGATNEDCKGKRLVYSGTDNE